MEYKHRLSLIVGRFQHIHKGHEKLIKKALEGCSKLLILVSSDEVLSINNPYTASYRIGLIERIFYDYVKNGQIIVRELKTPDYVEKYTQDWGHYLLSYAYEITGLRVGKITFGDDKDINKCFGESDLIGIKQEKIKRNELLISATELREHLSNDLESDWKRYTNELIYNEYNNLKIMLDSYKR